MKKITVILMMLAMVSFFGCEEPKSSKVNFEPICRKPASTDNYTTTDESPYQKLENEHNCFRKNAKHMVGMTFTAYPSRYVHDFYESTDDAMHLPKSFNVISPEKFTVIAYIVRENSAADWIKVKFESEKIGYIMIINSSPPLAEEAYPELVECLKISQRACQ